MNGRARHGHLDPPITTVYVTAHCPFIFKFTSVKFNVKFYKYPGAS